jgi:hypothetical protein
MYGLRGDEAGRGVNVFVKPATREGYYLVGFSESQEVQAKTSQELLNSLIPKQRLHS